MDGETILELTKVLLEFLERVGSSVATQAFQITLKKVYAEGVFALVISLICIPLFLKGLSQWKKSRKADNYKDRESLEFIGACLMIFTFIAFLMSMYMGLNRVIAPEFYAVQYIIDFIK